LIPPRSGFEKVTNSAKAENVDNFIKFCCKEIADIRGADYLTLKHQWVTRISATLQRANSYFLYHGNRRLMLTDPSSEFDIAQEAFANLEASG
jgi:hypothetical protein